MGNYLSSLTVEFVGLPGVGKTTVSQQVALKLRERNLRIVSRNEILNQWRQKNIWQKVFKLIFNNFNQWQILINSLIFASKVKPINCQSFLKAAKIFVNVKRNDAAATSKDFDIVLLDQGSLQETWSVIVTGNTPEIKYLKREIISLFYNRQALIVYCQIDIETSLQRIQNRQTNNSRFDLMDTAQAYSVLEKYTSYLEEIIDCGRACNTSVLELNSSITIPLQVEKVVDWIANQFKVLKSKNSPK